MIRSFADATLENFWRNGPSGATKKIPSSLHSALRRKLTYLDVARVLDDLRDPPGNRLEALSGDLMGWLSIRVNDQWRLVFQWNDGTIAVKLMDYH